MNRGNPGTHAFRGAVTASAAFVVLALLIPLLVISAVALETSPLHWDDLDSLDLATLIYSGARLAIYCGNAPPRYLAIVFFGFTYVWMGLAAFTQSALQSWPFGYTFDQGIQLEGAAIVALGILTYEAGRLLSRKSGEFASGHPAAGVRRLSATRVRVLAWIVLLGSPLAIIGLGGLGALFSNRESAANALFPSGVVNGVAQAPGDILAGTLLQDSTTVLSFVALYASLIVRRQRRRDGLGVTTGSNLLLLGLVVVNVIVNNPLSNPRQWFGTVLIALVLALPSALTIVGKNAFIAGMLMVTAILFTYGNAVRGPSYATEHQQTNLVQNWLSGDYDAAVEVAATAQYVEIEGPSYGRQLAGDVLYWVPRRFWSQKPIGTGYIIGYFYGTATPNVSAPLWAEGFMDFGWIGVMLFLLGFGYVSGLLDKGWSASYGALDLRRVILPLLAGYSFILLRGPLLPTMDKLVMFSVALWLLCPVSASVSGGAERALAAGEGRISPLGAARSM